MDSRHDRIKHAIAVQAGWPINGLVMVSEVGLMKIQVAGPLTREKKSSSSWL
jgi:hypothetical protein